MAKKDLGLTASPLSGRLGGSFEAAERFAARREPSRRKGIGGTALTDDTAKNLALRQQQTKAKGIAKLETPAKSAEKASGYKSLLASFAPTSEELPFEKSGSMPTLGSLVESSPEQRRKLLRAALAMRKK